MNPRHGTKTEHSSDAFHSVLTPSETTLTLDNTSRNACVSNNVSSTLSQPHLDSGISMSVNSTASREQISNIKPPWLTSFTVRDILTENERTHGRVESNHMTEPKTMKSNQMRISNSQLKTKLPAISPSNVLRYPRGCKYFRIELQAGKILKSLSRKLNLVEEIRKEERANFLSICSKLVYNQSS